MLMEKLLLFFERKFNSMKPMSQILLIGSVYGVLQLLAPVLLFYYSEDLGILWIVLFAAYTGLLIFAAGWIFYRREIHTLEAMYGTDFIYQAFPKEKKRRERKAKKTAEKALRKAEKLHRKEIERRDLGLR